MIAFCYHIEDFEQTSGGKAERILAVDHGNTPRLSSVPTGLVGDSEKFLRRHNSQ